MKVSASVLSQIREHGSLAYPFEACGFVFGHQEPSGLITCLSTYQAHNSREPEKQRRRFHIEAEEFLAAESQAEKEGLTLLAIYHSHPDHPALPSENDLQKGLPFYRYLIVSVENGTPIEITCWFLATDRSKFIADDLIIIDEN
jgi:proteasome lid subunit RPN8/RPN11